MPPARPTSSKKDLLPQSPVLLCIGTDSFRIRQTLRQLVDRFGGENNCERREYDAGQGETANALVDAASSSLFTPRRVVVLHQIEKATAEDLEAVLSYTRTPAEDCVLVLILGSKKSPKKALKEIMDKIPNVELKPPGPSEVKAMAVERLKKAEVGLDADALNLLLEHVGTRGLEALSELDKIILYAGPRGWVDLATCRSLLATDPEEDVWTITRNVAARDSETALMNLRRIFEQGVEPVLVLGMLARLFRQMWAVRTAEAEGIPRNKWSEATGLEGYPLQATIQQGSGFSLENLDRGLARIRATDDILKSSAGAPETALERLVVELSASS
ncbi:MAG TPA: DNA polymerase III subunit delta [bacterium]|nr:DNA polymerase III subunit delta [bacterium]HQO34092.1 DNA polymerase III subunit delta [bacterium]HQP98372.1 DNA polymerase III subunit delta [bacterium]